MKNLFVSNPVGLCLSVALCVRFSLSFGFWQVTIQAIFRCCKLLGKFVGKLGSIGKLS